MIQSPGKKTAWTAIFLSLAAAAGLFDGFLSSVVMLPFLRIGLANIFVLIALFTLGPWRASLIAAGKVFIPGLVSGTIAGPAFALSAAGTCASFIIMALLSRWSRASVFMVSLAGACLHNTAQWAVLKIMLPGAASAFLLGILLFLSLAGGTVTAMLAETMLSRINRHPS